MATTTSQQVAQLGETHLIGSRAWDGGTGGNARQSGRCEARLAL